MSDNKTLGKKIIIVFIIYKFFAQRLFLENKQYTDEDNPLYHIVKEQYKKAFNCTQSVVKFVDNNILILHQSLIPSDISQYS